MLICARSNGMRASLAFAANLARFFIQPQATPRRMPQFVVTGELAIRDFTDQLRRDPPGVAGVQSRDLVGERARLAFEPAQSGREILQGAIAESRSDMSD